MIIRQHRGQFLVVDHNGRALSRPYDDRADAVARLEQVERFNLRARPRKGRRNPLGSGFGFGLLVGAGVVGSVMGILMYRAAKSNEKAIAEVRKQELAPKT